MREFQASLEGYSGRPVSVFAAFDEDSGVLVVAAVTDPMARRPGCFLICADSRADRDALFAREQLQEAITAYLTLKNRGGLRIGQRATGADPGSAIEVDGITLQGPVYRISPDATNAQMATVALCLHASRAGIVEDVVEMAGTMKRLIRGEAVTV